MPNEDSWIVNFIRLNCDLIYEFVCILELPPPPVYKFLLLLLILIPTIKYIMKRNGKKNNATTKKDEPEPDLKVSGRVLRSHAKSTPAIGPIRRRGRSGTAEVVGPLPARIRRRRAESAQADVNACAAEQQGADKAVPPPRAEKELCNNCPVLLQLLIEDIEDMATQKGAATGRGERRCCVVDCRRSTVGGLEVVGADAAAEPMETDAAAVDAIAPGVDGVAVGVTEEQAKADAVAEIDALLARVADSFLEEPVEANSVQSVNVNDGQYDIKMFDLTGEPIEANPADAGAGVPEIVIHLADEQANPTDPDVRPVIPNAFVNGEPQIVVDLADEPIEANPADPDVQHVIPNEFEAEEIDVEAINDIIEKYLADTEDQAIVPNGSHNPVVPLEQRNYLYLPPEDFNGAAVMYPEDNPVDENAAAAAVITHVLNQAPDNGPVAMQPTVQYIYSGGGDIKTETYSDEEEIFGYNPYQMLSTMDDFDLVDK